MIWLSGWCSTQKGRVGYCPAGAEGRGLDMRVMMTAEIQGVLGHNMILCVFELTMKHPHEAVWRRQAFLG